ncbi:hypothetical protein ABQE57_24780 [Mycolicibacterium elephantis]
MLGGNVCHMHGGAAPQTRAKAQRRLQQAADALVQRLLSFALDGKVADPVALQAIRDALDRAGLNPKTGVELDVALKPYERILTDLPRLQGGSSAEWRRSQGIPDGSDTAAIQPAKAALEADADAPVDVEIIDDDDAPVIDADDQQTFARPITPDEHDWPASEPHSDDDSANPFDPSPDGLVTFDEAVIRAARINNKGAAGHVVVRRGQRALPRGRSQ